MNRKIGLLAMIVPVWFTGIYLILSTLRPEYSHLHKAISELGSVGAPRAWMWNLLGFILTGIAVALLGLGIGTRFAKESGARVPAWALVASGLFMALSGVFPGDFENRTSMTMSVHAVGSVGSFVVFLVAAFSLPRVLGRFREWRPFVWPSLALAGGSIVTGFLRTGSAPGLGQRLGFACFLLWVAVVGYALYCDPAKSDRAA
jgi:hypothetical membrane protein